MASSRPTWTAGVLTASAIGTTTLTLTWSGVSSDLIPGQFTYKIYRGNSEIAEISSPTATYDVTGLQAGRTYDFTVEAEDAQEVRSIDGPTARVTMQVADYFELQVKGVYSENTNYSDPKVLFAPSPHSVMPTEFIRMTVEGEISVGSDIDTSIFSSISLLIVKNLDTAQTLQLVIGNATHDNPSEGEGMTTRIAPGGIFVTTDVLAAGKVNVGEISGSGDGVIMCEVIVVGI